MPFEMSYTIPRKIYSSRAVEGILRNKNVPSEARDSQIHISRRQKYIFYIDSAVFSFENDPQSARKRSITTPRGHTVHDAPERVLLMESHIGVPVTILTSDYDSPNGSSTREIAKILLVRILCIELVGWNKLMIKV